MTIDEELSALDEAIRRLKIEYDIYFGGGSKRPPADTEWRVQKLIKLHSDSQKLNFTQRFKYNSIVQRYAIMSDLWRQKLKIREEGYRRPQDAILAIQGLRTGEEHAAAAALTSKKKQKDSGTVTSPFVIECADAQAERNKVEMLYDALLGARRATGETSSPGRFESFFAFVDNKTRQIRNQFHCEAVEYRVEVQSGRVALKARAKT